MLWVGFEPTIPEFERTKKVHVLDRTATVIDETLLYCAWNISEVASSLYSDSKSLIHY
jgi:hypothetical protein